MEWSPAEDGRSGAASSNSTVDQILKLINLQLDWSINLLLVLVVRLVPWESVMESGVCMHGGGMAKGGKSGAVSSN
jgi:hypothetical protein